MFFYLGPKPIHRFPHVIKLGHERIIEFDDGWVIDDDADQLLLSKGYLVPGLNHGNRLCFQFKKKSSELVIDWGEERTTPLYYSLETQELGNLEIQSNWKVLDYNEKVLFNPENGMSIVRNEETLWGCDRPQVSKERVLHLIEQRLDQKFTHLREAFHDRRKFLFLSGGLDTALQLACLIKHRIETEIVLDEHFESNPFLDRERSCLSKYWGYRQIHYWNQDCLLLSGANGDETFLRGPLIGGMLQVKLGKGPLSSLESTYHSSYASRYLRRPKVLKMLEHVEREAGASTRDYDDLAEDVCVRLTFDYQHWHLGGTWTWTPFKDLEISRILLQLGDSHELAEQFFEGALQKELIKKMAPECLDLVQEFKNEPLEVSVLKSSLEGILKKYSFLSLYSKNKKCLSG